MRRFGLMLVLLVAADKPLSKEEVAAKDFAFEGITLGMDEVEFVKTKPPLSGTTEYDPTNTIRQHIFKGEAATYVAAYGYRGKVGMVSVIWNLSDTKTAGGVARLADQLRAKYGAEHRFEDRKAKGVALHWDFPSVSRTIEFEDDRSGTETMSRLTVFDTVRWEAAQTQRKANTKTGLE